MSTVVEYIVQMRGNLSQGFTKMQSQVDRFDKSISTLGTALAGLGLGMFAKASIDAFDKSEVAISQVRQALISTGNAAGQSFEDLTAYSKELQNTTLFEDDEILAGVTAQLLSFTNIAGDNFKRTQIATMDLATRLAATNGGVADLTGTAIQLGKALNDPLIGMSMLGRSGVQFSKEQKQVIKSLVESGRLVEAQTLMLDELNKQYGGSAEAAADAASGMQQLKNVIGDIQESIGKVLAPIIRNIRDKFKDLATWIGNNEQKFQAIVKAVITFAAVIVTLTTVMKILNFVMAMNPIGAIIAAIALLAAGIVYLWNNCEVFRGIMIGIWEVLKLVGTFIKDKFMGIIDMFSNGWKGVGDALKNFFIKRLEALLSGLKGIGTAFKELFSGNFAEAAKAAGEAMFNLNTGFITGKTWDQWGEAGKKVGETFMDGFEKGKDAKTIGIAGITDMANGLKLGGNTLQGGDLLQKTESTITGAAPKIFNITIQTLKGIENFYNQNTTVKESSNDIEQAVTLALYNALADVQVRTT